MLWIKIESLAAGAGLEVEFLFYKEWSEKTSWKDTPEGGAEESVYTPS